MDDENPGEKKVNEIARPLGENCTVLDVDLSGNRKPIDGKEKLSTSELTQINNLCCASDEKFSLLRRASLELTELCGDEGNEKIVEEVRNFLPKWVTREQVSDIIRGTGGNIVEIVDNFYEHETKFYEQVSAVISFTSSNRVCSGVDAAPVSELEFLNCIPKENEGSLSTQFNKLQSVTNALKTRISPVKRNKRITSKPKKKAKPYSKPKSTDSKQATITKFFNKVSSNETKA